jgi:hypothetical protein
LSDPAATFESFLFYEEVAAAVGWASTSGKLYEVQSASVLSTNTAWGSWQSI